MRYKIHGREYDGANRNHPKYNIARNTFFHEDFSAGHNYLTAEDKTMADFAQISY